MINQIPINQTKLFGLTKFIKNLIHLFEQNKLPNNILLSGQKGLGKSTMAYHFINYVLSIDEEFKYDIDNFEIRPESRTFKTILNRSNTNFILIDIDPEKKSIDINQIRNLLLKMNKSSFNKKPRFVLIDNIDLLNTNSINALLKILEEPNKNVHFILINNNKKILKTLLSRCINFKIFLSNKDSLEVAKNLFDSELPELINKDLINFYATPGNIFNLIMFAKTNNYDLSDLNLKSLLKVIIKNKHYKKDILIKYFIFDLLEFYFNKISSSLSYTFNDEYSYFLKKISDTKKFNLDEESLYMEFDKKILNG
tara:strand:+ start:1437 stop:2369 length:933 start_codon:yes stop_codon:yes gene_type:complete